MMDRDEMLDLARILLEEFSPSFLHIDDGNTLAALSFAFSTGVQIGDEVGQQWLLSGDDMEVGSNNFSDAMMARRDGLLEFISTDFSHLVALAKEDSAAYDACLIIATSNLERGLKPELAEMLRSHVWKPSRPRKGTHKMALRDKAIQFSVYEICKSAKINPTRNGRNNNSGCDIVQEAMTTLPQYKRFGLPSYDGVRKIWDARKFPDRMQAEHDHRKK